MPSPSAVSDQEEQPRPAPERRYAWVMSTLRDTQATSRLVALGELLVDVSPQTPGTSLEDDKTLQPLPGGAPANVAYAATLRGARSAVVGAVGGDAFGRRLRRTLAEAGVDVTGLVSVEAQTAVAFVALGEAGEREFMFYGRPAAHDMLTAADVDAFATAQPFAVGDVLHLGSTSLAREPARSATLHALRLALRGGAAVSFDVNHRPALWDRPDLDEVRALLRQVLEGSQRVKLSLDELELLTGQRTRGAAAAFGAELVARDARLVTVTLGAEGTWYVTRDGSGHVGGYPVTAVDTTGAGDAFTAAVIMATLSDPATWDAVEATESALRTACAYAALSTTRPGAMPSYGTGRELAEFMSAARGQHGR